MVTWLPDRTARGAAAKVVRIPLFMNWATPTTWSVIMQCLHFRSQLCYYYWLYNIDSSLIAHMNRNVNNNLTNFTTTTKPRKKNSSSIVVTVHFLTWSGQVVLPVYTYISSAANRGSYRLLRCNTTIWRTDHDLNTVVRWLGGMFLVLQMIWMLSMCRRNQQFITVHYMYVHVQDVCMHMICMYIYVHTCSYSMLQYAKCCAPTQKTK